MGALLHTQMEDLTKKQRREWAMKHRLWPEVRELVRNMQDDINKQLHWSHQGMNYQEVMRKLLNESESKNTSSGGAEEQIPDKRFSRQDD